MRRALKDLPFRATSVSRRIHKSVLKPKDQAQQMLPEGAERGRYRGHYQIAAQCISNTVKILYNMRKDFWCSYFFFYICA